ncbi:MAG: two-component system, sensor histidine kinase and response regulator [Bacteroidota bacterium]|nr:two-component system, sensor histidine kinase and response regulator [Bacteroidota bacterium]
MMNILPEEVLEVTKMTILIVDDNANNLQLIGNILRNMNYKILVASDGAMALDIVSKKQPDIILLDIMMPEMDGFEVCRRLKNDEKNRDIPIIFLTSLKDTENIVEGFEAGGVDYITKPFKKEELLVRINTHLELKLSKDIIIKQNKQLKALNSTKEIQNRQLKELNATKDKFFSIISSDLRSPIISLINLAELLSGDLNQYSVKEIQQLAVQLHDSSIGLYKQLDNLLQWSRSQTGRIDFQPDTYDIFELLTRNIQIVNDAAAEKKIEIKNLVEPPLVLYFDQNMINTVLRNLIANAVKFTNNGGEVTLCSKDLGSSVEIIISDTGVGIDKDKIAKLFKIDTTFRTVGTLGELGSGLGLLLCKEFLEWHGCVLKIESESGVGSTFSFVLPKNQYDE